MIRAPAPAHPSSTRAVRTSGWVIIACRVIKNSSSFGTLQDHPQLPQNVTFRQDYKVPFNTPSPPQKPYRLLQHAMIFIPTTKYNWEPVGRKWLA